MSNQATKQLEAKLVFGQSVKARAQLNERPWSMADSTAVGRDLLANLTKNGEPIKLTEQQEWEIKLAFDAKRLQMATLARVADECGVELPKETRLFLERILDPAEFQQELIHAKLKKPSRKKRDSLTSLTNLSEEAAPSEESEPDKEEDQAA